MAALNTACESSCCFLSLSSVSSPISLTLMSLAAPVPLSPGRGTVLPRLSHLLAHSLGWFKEQNWVSSLGLAECTWHRARLPVPVWQGQPEGRGRTVGSVAKCPISTVISKLLPFHCHTVENSGSIKKENSLPVKQTLIRY